MRASGVAAMAAAMPAVVFTGKAVRDSNRRPSRRLDVPTEEFPRTDVGPKSSVPLSALKLPLLFVTEAAAQEMVFPAPASACNVLNGLMVTAPVVNAPLP